MKIKLIRLKSCLLITILGFLGFTACGDDDDIQPEYGVKAVYNKQKNSQHPEITPIIKDKAKVSDNKNSL